MNDPQTGEVRVAVELGQRAEVSRLGKFFKRGFLQFGMPREGCGSLPAMDELLTAQKCLMSEGIMVEGKHSLSKNGLLQ